VTIDPVRAQSDEAKDEEGAISVQIVSASAMVRAGLATLVNADERFKVSGSFSTGAGAADEMENSLVKPPDVIIAELADAPGDDLTELTKTLEETEVSSAPVVALLPDLEPELIANLLRSGVRAVLPRTATGEEILAALEAAAAGLVVIHRDALGAIEEMRTTAREAKHESPVIDGDLLSESLTPREREVLGMIAEGLSNKEIAWRLQISEHTAKFHVSSILAKLDASSRTEAVTQGLRRGLILM
jgi:DNA-binding NarL/FixJ family response regulator